MNYLIAKIILCLLGSAVVGGFIVYWLTRRKMMGEMESIDDWRMKYQLLAEDQERHRSKFLLLKDQYTRGCEETRKLKAEINDLKERGNSISLQRDEFEAKYIDLMEVSQETLARKDERHKNRKKHLLATNYKVNQLLERVSLLSSQKKDIDHSLKSIQGEKDQLNTQIIDLGDQGEKVRNHLRLVTDERDKLTQQIEALKQEKSTFEDQVDTLIKDQQILSAKVDELKQERDGYMGRLNTLSEVAK